MLLLLSDSYDDGLRGRPYSGRDYGGYIKGRDEAERIRNTLAGNPQPASGGSSSGPPNGDAGNFWGKLILGVVFIGIALPSFFTALIATIFLIPAFKLFNREPVSYPQVYLTSFWTSFAYLSTAAFAAFVAMYLYPGNASGYHGSFIAMVFDYFFALTNPEGFPTDLLLKFHGACIFIAALTFYGKSSAVPKGLPGFLSSILLTVVVILPSFLSLLLVLSRVMPKQYQYVIALF